MKDITTNKKSVYLTVLIISVSLICFEILSTRISSVIFVHNYAFIILSLAILGLGTGGIFSYYAFKIDNSRIIVKIITRFIITTGISFIIFIFITTQFSLTNPLLYFFLLFLPFFFTGIVYSLIFKKFASHSFSLYAFDLVGAALGSGAAIAAFTLFSAPNAVIFLSVIIFMAAVIFAQKLLNKKIIFCFLSLLILGAVLIIMFGHTNYLGRIPIGNYPEKDFYHVYSQPGIKSKIIDSRWSIYGRSDLVEYSHQDMVKQLFIDGAAGTQMFRFKGNIKNLNPILYNLLVRFSTTIPFMFLREHERDRMLVIGPGGGKEVLIGLLSGIKHITGVEVNPDFVDIVRDHSDFNGGIYTDFPQVDIQVKEGRHYIKKTDQKYDIIVIALPSTEQLQNIDNFAMSENYLLTAEAIQDYLNILTSEGRLIFTVHNRWELIRLLVTVISAFNKKDISNQEALNHFVILAPDYAPTIVIKKNAFSRGEIAYINNVINTIPSDLPSVTYLPFHWETAPHTLENKLLRTIKNNQISLQHYIDQDQFDISAVHDDSPYFYKVKRGIPDDYLWLLSGISLFALLVVVIPYSRIKKKIKINNLKILIFSLTIFICIGLGFMILEVTLFQKLVLYLGSPTISLSILLSSLLISMGIGSFSGNKIFPHNFKKRIGTISLLIVATGVFCILIYPVLLNNLLAYSQVLRSLISFFLLLPFGFLLGILFPSSIQILQNNNLNMYIPWMYGVNGIMSVLGSILAVIFSMLFGFTPAFFVGLSMYLVIFIISQAILRTIPQ